MARPSDAPLIIRRRPPPADSAASEIDDRDTSFFLGLRAGYTHAFGDLAGARIGLDGWWPFRVGRLWLGVGISASYGQATREVADGAGLLRSTSRAEFFPLTTRLGCEVARTGGLSVVAGLGATVTLARFTTTLGPSAAGAGAGALGFASLGWTAGPGQIFAEASLGSAPASGGTYQLDAGGASLDVGYRFRIP